MWVVTFARALFIPLFMLCNVQPRKSLAVFFYHDAIPMVLSSLCGISNGYISTLCMMYGPRLVSMNVS